MYTRSRFFPLFVGYLVLILAMGSFLAPSTALAAAEQKDAKPAKIAKGWERGSEYNKLYDMDSFMKVKGSLEEIIETTPLPGMEPGLGVRITPSSPVDGLPKGESLEIQFGPKDQVRFLTYVANRGDKLTVRGSLVKIDGKPVLMGSKIKVNEIFEFKVRRTKDGTPYWTLTPKELIEEKLEQ